MDATVEVFANLAPIGRITESREPQRNTVFDSKEEPRYGCLDEKAPDA
jgi:hypothetical protein